MDYLNKLRLAAGLPIDGSREKTIVKEAKEENEQSVANMHLIKGAAGDIFYLVTDATPHSQGIDVISKVSGSGFASIFIGGGSESEKEHWKLFKEHQVAAAVDEANKRLRAANAKYIVTESDVMESEMMSNIGLVADGFKKVISMLKNTLNKEKSDSMKKMYAQDLEDYENILDLAQAGKKKAVGKAWSHLDTAARDYVFGKNKKMNKIMAGYLGVDLLHEDEDNGYDRSENTDGAGSPIPVKVTGPVPPAGPNGPESSTDPSAKVPCPMCGASMSKLDFYDHVMATHAAPTSADGDTENTAAAGGDGKDTQTTDTFGFQGDGSISEDKSTTESMHYYVDVNKLSHGPSNNPLNVIVNDEKSNIWKMGDTPGDQADYPENPIMPEHGQKVATPAEILTLLKDEIAKLKKDADAVEFRDSDRATFYRTTSDALETILKDLQRGDVMGIKYAQIDMVKLMGPIAQHIPDKVRAFITNGGAKRSLKSFYKKV